MFGRAEKVMSKVLQLCMGEERTLRETSEGGRVQG